MVRILVFIVVYVFSELGFAQTSKNEKIDGIKQKTVTDQVVINNINSNKGAVCFALYHSESNFCTKNPFRRTESNIEEGSVKVILEDLELKAYAVVCFHDASENGKRDFQNNGMPLEYYRMTNNVISFGPPHFDKGKFELINKDVSFEIKF